MVAGEPTIASAARRKRVGVLISGRGSNLQALLDAAADPTFPAEIVLVISNRSDAAGLARAAEAGVPHLTVDHRDFQGRVDFDAAMTAALEEVGVEIVALAGFMRILSTEFVDRWQGAMINVHPSLLPLFPGLDTHARAIAEGVRLHGCSVHFVGHDVDSGPIIGQAAVAVADNDTPDSLAARVLAAEHGLYPACLKLVASGKVRIQGNRTEIEGAVVPRECLFSLPTA